MAGTVLGVLFGIFLLFLVGQALWGPLRFLLRLVWRLVLGGACLVLLNLGTQGLGWGIGINPLSLLTAGLLGLPGLVLLGVLKLLFGPLIVR